MHDTKPIETRGHPIALTWEPSASLAECELSFVDRQPIVLARARAEHAGYCAALRAAGLEVLVLPPLDALPDAAFVEDTAVVVDEIAVLAAPGVPSRAAESEEIGGTLAAYRPVHRLATAGGTLEGGDVLRIGPTIYVGHIPAVSEIRVKVIRMQTGGACSWSVGRQHRRSTGRQGIAPTAA